MTSKYLRVKLYIQMDFGGSVQDWVGPSLWVSAESNSNNGELLSGEICLSHGGGAEENKEGTKTPQYTSRTHPSPAMVNTDRHKSRINLT